MPTAEPEEGEMSEQIAPVADLAEGTDLLLRFVGGPLDGRVQAHEARHGDPLPTITHVHLHGGPKVVHRYDRDGASGVYRLRTAARRSVREDPSGG